MEWKTNVRLYKTEYVCEHGVGHDDGIHGCCHKRCCSRDDCPLNKKKND